MTWQWTPASIGLVAVTTVCGLAMMFGEALERRAALWILAAWVATPFLQVLSGALDPVLLFTAVDVVTFGALLALGWRSGRRWPGWALAVQGTGVAIHLARLVDPGMSARTYLTALTVAAYCLLLSLALGTWSSWRRRRRAAAG